ncbi:hypothetical protein [Serratia fonticola]
MVTESTCALATPEYRPFRGATEVLSDFKPGSKLSAVTLNLKQCPQKIFNDAIISLRDVAETGTPLDFIYHTGGKIAKDAPVELANFIRKSPLEIQLPFIVARPPSDDASEGSIVVHISYD